MLTDAEYTSLLKTMRSLPGISSTLGKRRNAEQRYFIHHRARGVRLRGKYCP